MASSKSGLDRINKSKKSENVGDFKSKATKTAPKNKLPESPINIFAGAQFTKRNAIKQGIIGQNIRFIFRLKYPKITKMHPPTKPSIPSMKLTKLIIPEKAMTIKINKKK